MKRVCVSLGILLAAAGCSLGSAPSGPQAQTPYAVIYGHVGAPANTINITVMMAAYDDSAHAVAEGSTGYVGSYQVTTDTANDYLAAVPASAPGTFYLDVLATGQGHGGYLSSIDTIRALRVRFDSIGGTTPHDSIEVDDSLP